MPTDERPSRQVLEEIPSRVFTFLLNVAKYPVIFSTLALKSYSQEEHDFAWGLLSVLGHATPTLKLSVGPSAAVREAVAELDAWDEPNFEMMDVTLRRKYPAIATSLFENLTPKQGIEAVGSVSTLLDRLDALDAENSADAKGAIKLLGTRGYTKEERKRLRDLVNVAKTVTAAPVVATDEEMEQARLDLYGWFNEWSTIAKRTIKRRQYLIALGLASPRKSEKKAKGEKKTDAKATDAEKKTDAKAADAEKKGTDAEKKAADGEKKAPAKPAEGDAAKPA